MKVIISGTLQDLPDEYARRLYEQGEAKLPEETQAEKPRPKRTKEVSNNEPEGQDRG